MANEIEQNNGEIIIYQSEDGKIKLDVRLENNTVWLSQEQIALLFSKGRTTITEHISNIFKEGELNKEKVCRKIRHATQHGAVEGKTQSKEVTLYNLDVIISVGYRVKSIVGTRFRQWATERLAEYIIKGFTMDDERLTNLGGGGLEGTSGPYSRYALFREGNRKDLLIGAGTVSHEEAMEKAMTEYRKFQVKSLSPVEQAYLESIKFIDKKAKGKKD